MRLTELFILLCLLLVPQGSSIWLDKPPQLLWRADGTPGTTAAAAAAAVAGDSGQQQQQPVLGDALGTWVNTLVVDRGVSYQVRRYWGECTTHRGTHMSISPTYE